MSFPHSSVSKESACNAGDRGSIPGLGKILWRRKWQSTPVFLPRKSHGQRRLVGHSQWGRKSQTRFSYDCYNVVSKSLVYSVWSLWHTSVL